MSPLAPRALFFLLLAAPLRAGQIEGRVNVELPGQNGSLGAGLGAPAPLQLTVPSLSPGLAPSLTPSPLLAAPAPLPAPAAAGALDAARPIPALPPSAIAVDAAPAALAAAKPAAFAADAAEPSFSPAAADAGRALFDQAAPKRGVLDAVKNFFSWGEAAPAWPGKAGQAVRVGAIKTTLDSIAGQGGTSTVWKSRDGNFAVKLLHPQAMNAPGAGDEASILRAIDGRDLPFAKLYAESSDGRVLIKEFVEGRTAHELAARGKFDRSPAEGWAELAAKLIRGGVTADLAPGNLVWQHWRSRWMVVDAGGLKDGGPADVLRQLAGAQTLRAAGLRPGDFLSGLRARLGSDSPRWLETEKAIRERPVFEHLRPALDDAIERGAGAPRLVFSAAPKGPAGIDDSVVTPKELVKRFGWDPRRAKEKVRLHGDDPGKLNTQITALKEPGRPELVMKIAQWDIIRNEVAVRRLARRFFGRYFRVPASLAVKEGLDSWMIMERADASPSYGNPFNLEQRVAVALFARTFGISDVNQGNVLTAHGRGLPWMIDFEQAFGRSDPNTGKHIPDERIALEKPWMHRRELNVIEQYQPAIKAWRATLKLPESRAGIEADLVASGFTKAEAAGLLALFDANAADLDWTLQNDADFVNQFVARNAGQGETR